MFSEGLEKWDQVCWSRPCCEQGSGTEVWAQTGTREEEKLRDGRPLDIFKWLLISRKGWFVILTWNRWPPWRRVAGLRGATGLSVLQKWMLDSRGLGVNSRVGVWGKKVEQDSKFKYLCGHSRSKRTNKQTNKKKTVLDQCFSITVPWPC